MKSRAIVFGALVAVSSSFIQAAGVTDCDPRMAVERAVVTNGVRWIGGLDLPMEGRMFKNVDAPSCLSRF